MMTPPPSAGLVDGVGLAVDGHLRLMALVAIVAVVAAYAVLLWAIGTTQRRRTSEGELRPDGPDTRIDVQRPPGRPGARGAKAPVHAA
jgi:hypothetical protein